MPHRTEANLAALIESTEDLIWSMDLAHQLITFNKAFQRHFETFFGTRPAVGLRPEDLVPPEMAEKWNRVSGRALSDGRHRVEYTFDGGRIMELSFNPIVVEGQTIGVSGFGKDITAHKRSEEALRESLDVLRDAQRVGALGSYVLDIGTMVWTSSAEMDEIFGIGKDYEHTLAGWSALIHPEDRAMLNSYFADEVLAKGNQFDKEYRIIRPLDGEERWLHGLGRLDFDAQGKPAKMRGVIKDITGRKQVELELRDSEARYRETFEQAAVGIVHTSFDGKLLRCNARFAQIVGYSLDEIAGLNFRQISVPEDSAENDAFVERVLRGNAECDGLEKRYRRKDGSLVWTRVTASIQRDSAGQPLHFIAVIEDISDRKIAEERLAQAQIALEESEACYRTAFQTSLDGIAISHLEDGKYIDANKTFLDMLGYGRAEFVGRTSHRINLWVDADDRDRLVEKLRRDASFRDLTVRFRKKSGDLIWVLLSCSLMEIKGANCILTVARDITEAKAAKERLAAAKEAQRLSEARYRTAFQTSPNGVAINRLEDGMYLDVNGTFLEEMGYDRDEVVGQTTRELNIWVDPGDRERVIGALLQDSVFRGDLQFRQKSGQILWGRMSASLFEHEGVTCILSVTQDITDAMATNQRLAEAQIALLKSEERYRTAFQTSLDAVTINRLSDGMYIECNAAFLETTGYKRHEVVGRTSLELNIWADSRDRKSLVDIVLQFSSCRDLEVRHRKKNGELYWGLISASLIETRRRAVRAMCYAGYLQCQGGGGRNKESRILRSADRPAKPSPALRSNAAGSGCGHSPRSHACPAADRPRPL